MRPVLVNSGGETRVARTNSFGYYRFENLEIGTYVVSAQAKQDQFAQTGQVLAVFEAVADFNIVAESLK